ncbi:MAG TPA: ketol-acid reductoisomerase [Armatimonadota bacterium]|nr:ketol-acid reductoisomerase [Armatimonadota bacterium]
MAKLYYDDDASLDALKDKTIAIIGYGIQGRGQGLNLRDSGCKVVVADIPGSPAWENAKADGQTLLSTEEAAEAGDIVQILTEDHVQARVYETQVKAHLKDGNALFFSHGFNIHYNQIVPPKTIDVLMVAPKGPGSLVRQQFEKGGGVPCLLAIHQDYTGKAKEIGLAYAKAIGGTRGGVFETTFREETETDLFGEQAVLCGGLSALIKAGFDTLVEAGYQPEMAYFECCHELKLIMDMVFKYGISGMRKRVSNTAAYGDMSRGPRVIDDYVREVMREMLREVQTGQFAKEWILECMAGRPVFKRVWEQDSEHPIESIGAELRSHMPWLEDM